MKDSSSAQEGAATRGGGPQVDLRARDPLRGSHIDVLDRSPTLVHALEEIVARQPDFVALRILGLSLVETRITIREIWDRARQLHAYFVGAGLQPGSLAILSLPTGVELVSAYFAVLLAGGVPGLVAAPSNRFADRKRYASRVAGILGNAEARILYCESEHAALFIEAGAERSGSVVLSAAQTKDQIPEVPVYRPEPSTIATVQYSSGTTGNPKGVLVTHGAILTNLRGIRDAFGLTANDVAVNWIPLYHDMGLMGAFLLPFFMGSPIAMIPTLDFMKQPPLWLWAAHHYGATMSWAPNFAFSYCAKHIAPDAVEGLDLSSWRIIINASEPVLIATVDEFFDRYRSYGLERKTLQTAWGMAEAVVMATANSPDRELRVERLDRKALARSDDASPTVGDGLAVVCVGRPLDRCAVEIRDPEGRALGERKVGRIWLRSPALFIGYHRQPDATAEVLRDGWFDTGDRGYIADDELFFVSRDKDLIVIGGEKYPPHDVETAIYEVPGVRRGCAAAFGLMNEARGTEEVVVVVETHETDPATLSRMRQTIAAEIMRTFGLAVRHVVLTPPGGIEKTTSGKTQRIATRDRYVAEIARLQSDEGSPA